VLSMRAAFLCLMLVSMPAWSNDPTPGAQQEVAPPSQQSRNAKCPSDKDDNATGKEPFFVKMKDAQKTASNANETKKEGSDKPSFIWGMTAEEATAVFTFYLVIVGALTALVLISQSILLRRQVSAAREEFNAVHRPRIRVRHIWPIGELWGGKQIAINTQIVNAGVTTAKITEYSATTLLLSAENQLPAIPQYGYRIVVRNDTFLESGHSTDLPPISEQIRPISDEDNAAIRDGKKVLYCFGYVTYEDSKDRPRTTAFCRRLKPPIYGSENGKFVLYEDPDYEYED